MRRRGHCTRASSSWYLYCLGSLSKWPGWWLITKSDITQKCDACLGPVAQTAAQHGWSLRDMCLGNHARGQMTSPRLHPVTFGSSGFMCPTILGEPGNDITVSRGIMILLSQALGQALCLHAQRMTPLSFSSYFACHFLHCHLAAVLHALALWQESQ